MIHAPCNGREGAAQRILRIRRSVARQHEPEHEAHDSADGNDLPGIGMDVLVGRLSGRTGFRQCHILNLGDADPGRLQRFLARARTCATCCPV